MAKSKMLKLLSKLSAAALSVLTLTSVLTNTVKADDPTPKELTQVITGVELLDASDTKQNVTSEGDYAVRTGNAYRLRVTFDLKQYNENLNNGDYFTFDIPAPMTVYNDSIELSDPVTRVNIGQAVVTSSGNDKGGKAKITLKNLDKYLAATGGDKVKDVSGNFAASFRFLKDQTKTPISFNSSSMKQEVTHTYTSKTISGPKVGTENYAKSGGQASRQEWTSEKLAAIGSVSKGNEVSNWRVRVNTEKQDFGQNIVLHDTIPNDDTSYTPAQYIPESLKIYKADITGGTSAVPPGATLMVEGTDYTVAWNSNYTSFDVTLKDGTASYFVTYSTTTPNDGTKVANIAALSLADGTKLAQNTSRPNALSMKAEATSLISGTIVASTAYQIKINKTDAFTLSPVQGAVYTVTAADDASETTEVTTNEKGVALTKTYDQKWEGKTFKIKEKTAPAGYKLDEKEYTVKLGAAGSTINLKDEPVPAVFNVTAKKVVEGRTDKLPKADEFTFNLYTAENLKTPVATAKSKADGTITFENIEVKGAGTYRYIIKEDTSAAINGITFDEEGKEVTVTAAFQGGVLKASITSAEPTFTNTYKAASTSATIKAKKVLNGKELAADAYTFELKEKDAVVAEAKNAASGEVVFNVNYTEAGEHTYTITEKSGTEAGVTYSTESHTVKVTVADNGQGQLVATVENADAERVFTNTYKAASTSATIKAKKVLNGKELVADAYTFELKEKDAVVAEAKNAASGEVVFNVNYTEAGEHTYTITEKSGTEAGVTYSTESHTVKVTVVDNGQGQLVATVENADAERVFTNTYKAASTSATIKAKKVLNGKELAADAYTFELKEKDAVVAEAKNAASGEVVFNVNYTEAGEHTYTITEKSGTEAGVTYSTESHTVKVTVVDNGQGQLVATVENADAERVFTNTYKAASTSATIKAKKVLNGKELVADAYTFELKEKDAVVAEAKNAASGEVVFNVNYTEAGEHTYTITEKSGTEAGVTYSTESHTVKVTVADNGQGQLVATVENAEAERVFTNTYKAASTSATIKAKKVLNGKELAADAYTFELKEKDAVVAEAKNAASGEVVFNVNYTEAGEHTYTITEKSGTEAGVTYSTESHTVKVTVADNGQGQLVATVENADAERVFTNTYKAASTSATIKAKKVLNGKELVADAYTFELKEKDAVVAEAKNAASGEVVFNVNYTEAGEHTYTITEKSGTEAGVTYSTESHTVKVTVADNGQGQLVATVENAEAERVFTNTYKAASTSATIKAKKVLNGKELAADAYTFELKEKDAVVAEAKNAASGEVVFNVNYTEAGEHTYTITEKSGTEAGVTYSTESHTVKVTVADNGQGQLVATVENADAERVFTNTYKAASTSATIKAKKVLNGKELAADAYTFELKEKDAVVAEAKNAASGEVVFNVNYTEAGEHTYTITEKSGTEAGVTYSTESHTVKVTVADNGQGQLVATVENADAERVFTNTYKAASTSATIKAKKVLNGKELAADAYTFELKEKDAVVAEAKNAASGEVVFNVNYTEAGEHTYTITEKSGTEAGVTYSTESHTVKVTVVDNGQGQLVATVENADAERVFTNTYKAASTSATIKAKKVLNGKELAADAYTFELKEKDAVVAEAKNAASGEVVFNVNYTEAGEHTYTITEKSGTEAGVTYSTESHTVKVNVVDNGQGQLVATVENAEAERVFTNTYKAASTSATIKAKKVLNGKELAADAYTFELKEKDAVVAEAKNAASGEVVFNVNYTEAGEHTYTITEKSGTEAGVTYSTESHTVKVTVADNGQGQLVATVENAEAERVFTNTYKAASTSATIKAKKVLNGKELAADAYTFELKEKDAVVAEAKNAASGEVVFNVNYTEAGEHTYTITEKSGTEAGVTYSTESHTVKVTVADNGQGQLVATVENAEAERVFTNTYKAASTSATIKAKKVLNGKELAADAYTFELKEKDAVVAEAKNAASGEVVFNVNYTEAGEHTYTITEKSGTEAGVTYSTESHTVKVTVADNGQGQLVATVENAEAERVFTNTYKAASTSATIKAKKVLNGKELVADAYTFELKEKDAVVAEAKNAASGEVVFNVNYTEAGEHTYTITEKSGTEAGVTYSTESHTVKVTVADNGQGQLVATVENAEAERVFTNTYKAASTSATIKAKKVLNGKELVADAYTFELKEKDAVVAEAKNAASGEVVFNVNYTEAGEHTYTITEKSGTEAGVTYSTESHTVKVNVVDNGQGQLVATVENAEAERVFTNTYKAASTSATIKAKKVLNGKELVADAYTFELKEKDAVVAEAKNAASGEVVFNVNYTEAGEHTYTITEKSGTEAGVTYSTESHTVKVTVADNGQGQLVATVENAEAERVFTNTYKAASTSATIKAKKVLNGKELAADAYTFELKEKDAVVAEAKNAASGEVVFNVNYTEAGEHTYTITEKSGTEAGVTYSTESHTVKVTVADNGQGQLVATVENAEAERVFTNTYKAASTSATIKAKKVLNGKELVADAYTFELKEKDAVVAEAKNAASGEVVFNVNYTEAGEHTYTITEKSGTEAGVTYSTESHTVKVTVADNGQGQLVATVENAEAERVFTNTYKAASTSATIKAKKVLNGKELVADAYTFELKEKDAVVAEAKNAASGEVVFNVNYTEAGEHTYTITEKSGTEAGVTYSTESHTVKVNVVDNGQGQLVATVENAEAERVFTNTYKAASTSATIKAKKVLNGKELVADAYTFELKEKDAVVAEAKNAASGEVVFNVNYTEAGEHTYTITEKSGTEAGVTYSTESHTVKVNVVDNGQGLLVATVENAEAERVFTNTYKAPVPPAPTATSATLAFTKELIGRALVDGEFQFELYEGTKLLDTKTNQGGKVTFNAINYDAEGVHTYTVKEVNAGATGITYDTEKTAVVTVTKDAATNALKATVEYPAGSVFTNSFKAPAVEATIEATKKLEGKELAADAYTFELKENGAVVAEAKNTAEGKVAFVRSFEEAGTHTYTLVEKVGTEEGVEYDKTEHTVTVTVVADGQGLLTATVSYADGKAVVFTNKYTVPNPTPDPNPAPNPNPTPDPAPNPNPTPDPNPTPNPNPTPDPTPDPAPTPDPTPNEPGTKPNVPGEKEEPKPTPPATETKGKAELPKTGEATSIFSALGFVVLALSGLVFFVKRKA